MGEKIGLRDAVQTFASEMHWFLYRAFINEENKAPYTFSIIGVVCGIFLVELYLTITTSAASSRQIVAYLFINYPEPMWAIAPFIHRGLLHFGANVAGLYILSPLESQISRRHYTVLLITAGFIPVYADGVKIALLSTKEHAAAYGISGFLFGLLGFGVVHLYSKYQSHSGLDNREWVIVLLGVSSIVSVLVNLVTAFFDPLALKIGHLGGISVGILFGIYHKWTQR